MTKLKLMQDENSERTLSTPIETMCDSVLGFVRIWAYSFVNVLDLCTIAMTTPLGTAIVDMHVSAHRSANTIAHHRSSLVIRGELATPQLECGPVYSVNCPASLCHGAMTGFVFLLRMAFKYRPITISICRTLWGGTLPKGKVQK